MSDFETMLETLKKAAAAMRDEGIPYMLGGGLAAWARGGPETDHDVDFVVKREDADRALQALADQGMKPERPPEGWLFKAYHDGTLIDLIFHPSGGAIGDEHFARGEELEVAAQTVTVASLDDVMTTKLLSLNEQDPDFASVLEFARSLREQIDWDFVREQTSDSPFARAFFTLTEELGIVDQQGS